jgi:hypothetical protein
MGYLKQTQIKEENRQHFLKILETVLNTFLNKQLNEERYSHQFTESDLKEFLSITVELSSTHSLQHPCCLLIIRQLLFRLDKTIQRKSRKLRCLFERLNNLDKNLYATNDSALIIQDEWLTDYTFHIPQEWWLLDRSDYQSLCDIHHNNTWSIYIWSKIVHLSFIKSEITKPNELLMQLNEWMSNVKHDIYDRNDTLTIIFVKNIFEIVIAKYIKSILFVPNIGSILQYILRIKKEQPHFIDTKQMDDFIQNVQHAIRDILSLNSKSNSLEHLRSIFLVLKRCKV